MISAKILADSINPQGNRITTWMLKYNRTIHAEFMTHRDFSRNASSSRAIPLQTTIREVNLHPALPSRWGSRQKGMASGPDLDGPALEAVKMADFNAREECLFQANIADSAGVHKSITNRWLEPWSHITVIATATDHHNFFALRAHPAAQPEFQVLAYRMLEAYIQSTPEIKYGGEWHIPFVDDLPRGTPVEIALKIATARCCWVSYNKPDKIIGQDATMDDAITRHDESAKQGHWSPFEHCAKVMKPGQLYSASNFDTEECPSYWLQYRKTFAAERRTSEDTDLLLMLANRPEWTRHASL